MIVKRKNKDHSFGFVIFEDKKSAKSALNDKFHKVAGVEVECQIAQPKIRSYLNKVKDKNGEVDENGEESRAKKKKKKKKKRKNKSKENSKAPSKISSKEADDLYIE
jgi:hypothetical protein